MRDFIKDIIIILLTYNYKEIKFLVNVSERRDFLVNLMVHYLAETVWNLIFIQTDFESSLKPSTVTMHIFLGPL